MSFLAKSNFRISSQWDGLTWAIVVMASLTFVALPFARTVNAPLALLALIAIWLLATRWTEIIGLRAIRWVLVLICALWIPQLLALSGAANVERALGTAAYYPFYGLSALPVIWAAYRYDIMSFLLNITLAVSVVWAIDGLIQFFFGSNLFGFPYNYHRLTGMFYPNLTMGVVMAQMLPLALEATRRLMHRHWVWGIVLLPVLMTIVLSGSRSAMIVMGLAVFAYGAFVALSYRIGWRLIVAVLLGFILAIGAALSFSPQARDRLTVTTKVFDLDREAFNEATAMRGDVWAAGWDLAQDAPWLGVGVRGFEELSVERGYSDRSYAHLHFFALDVQVSTGLIGLLSYLVAYFGFLLFMWRYGLREMAGGVAVLGVGLALWPLNTHFGFYASYTQAMVWPIIALATGLVVDRRCREEGYRGIGPERFRC
ncbi:O-antigen ligase family protein [Halothiobacillus sp.]|uniref:O-antigen ligase family protein n=1 Tax=Halothiobacillus sp. TaxID=1891311 RepID=UPI002AD534F0|nr:O-antigen ligase family protein [Halothiobacillus sp.]